MAQDHDERRDQTGAGHTPDAADAAPGSGRTTRRPLDATARARIGRGLRLHYAAVLALPVPDHLRTLLDDLAARSDREFPR